MRGSKGTPQATVPTVPTNLQQSLQPSLAVPTKNQHLNTPRCKSCGKPKGVAVGISCQSRVRPEVEVPQASRKLNFRLGRPPFPREYNVERYAGRGKVFAWTSTLLLWGRGSRGIQTSLKLSFLEGGGAFGDLMVPWHDMRVPCQTVNRDSWHVECLSGLSASRPAATSRGPGLGFEPDT